MGDLGFVGLILLMINALFTYKGFKERSFFNQHSFQIDKILVDKDYKRLVTSGFLHINWMHFGFNMLTLYFFSTSVELMLGPMAFLTLYFVSLLGGNLLSLYLHRNHAGYSAVGASGAVSGVVFAAIALFPDLSIGFFLMPFRIPGWLYGISYVLYSIYGIKSQRDNIGHEAHLGGGLVGLIVAVLFVPASLLQNLLPILLILVPSFVFIYVVVRRQDLLLVDNPFKSKKGFETIEDKYNAGKLDKQKEIDKILDKINKKGINKLSKQEREKLERLTQ